MWTPENFGGFWKKARSAAADVRFGQKQTFTALSAMSALPPKADIRRLGCDVRFVPIADIQ